MSKLRILSFLFLLGWLLGGLTGCRDTATPPTVGWRAGFSGTGWDGLTAAVSAGSDFFAVGYTESTDGDAAVLPLHSQAEALLLRIGADGAVKKADAFGGEGGESFRAVTAGSGGVLAAGFTDSTDGDLAVTQPQGQGDALLVKYTTVGEPVWIARYGGSGDDAFWAVAATADGGSVAVGRTGSKDGHFAGSPSHGDMDGCLVRYDDKGTALWSVTFGGTGRDEFTAVVALPGGGYVAAGFTESTDGDLAGQRITTGGRDAVMVKYSENGAVEWVHLFGGTETDEFNALAAVRDGCVAVGRTRSADGDMTGLFSAGQDGVAVKVDRQGQRQWVTPLGGTGVDSATAAVADGDGVIVAGTTSSTDLFFEERQPQGEVDMFLTRLGADGLPTWRAFYGTGGGVVPTGLCAGNGGWLLVGHGDAMTGDLQGLTAWGQEEGFALFLR